VSIEFDSFLLPWGGIAMPKDKRNDSSQDDTQVDLIAEQFQTICHDLLSRPLLRRGPFVIEDSVLRAMITTGSVSAKARRTAVND
jgi:hypothetical protein